MPIMASDVSVVVQGPVAGKPDDPPALRLTAACLDSVRRHLPGAEVILSTWAGSDTRGLAPDVLVESADPGAVSCARFENHPYNLNRQLLSSSAGLARATRPFAMKLRADMRIDGLGFLDLFERFPKRHPDWQVFGSRVVVCDLLTQHPYRTGFALSPSDWFSFGRTEDVRKLWAAPLDTSHEVARYFENRPRPQPWRIPGLISRYNAEQYIWLNALRSYGPVPFEHGWDASREIKRLTELTFANNLIVADETRLGIRFCKYRPPKLYELSCYSHEEWVGLYRSYCDSDYPVGSVIGLWFHHHRKQAEVIARKIWGRAPAKVRQFGSRFGVND